MAVRTILPGDLSGQTIKGYELQQTIGKGGFGAVYRAYQPAVRRDVAVKVILPEYANHPDFVRRFEAEAQLVAHLEHPHIVPLYDYWRDATGAFLVMRWLKGGSLRAVLAERGWPLNDAIRLIEQITAALAAAHRQGVIHRDLKPDNILLDEDKNAYLADFGIAKDLHNLTQLETLYANEEQQGQLMGSPYYLSPEQIRSDPVSPQSDIYSLGIMLYEIVTNRLPFEGLPLSTIITKHLQEPLPHLHESHPELPLALNLVIARATEKNPSDRYPDAAALYLDFRRALAESGFEGASATQLTGFDYPADTLNLNMEFVAVNPYKGLRAFQEADSEDFFGREALIAHLLAQMQKDALTARFLGVVGPSGSGKSSVVKAGLIPRLRAGGLPGSERWFIVEMTPGIHPLEELEAALLRIAINPPASLMQQLQEDERGLIRAVKRALPPPPDTCELVLIIDQFEEVFTQTINERERVHFLQLLDTTARDANSRVRIIITLRADFYDRPLLYDSFGALLRECTEVVLPLTRDELVQAVSAPAEKSGLALESGLVGEIVADVSAQPGALPLLQYALTELYERRDGRWLTLDAYRQIGGIAGALAQRADELYHQLDKTGQRAARQAFLRLVALSDAVDDTRRRVRQDELLSLPDSEAIFQALDYYAKHRLITLDRDPLSRVPTVEVAHEALIRQWPRLRGWLEQGRESLQTERRLAAAANEWAAAGYDSGYLLSGSRLDSFEVWAAADDISLTALERRYLEASHTEQNRLAALEAARQAKEAAVEKRSRNILRALVGVLAVATLGAFGLTSIALNQQQAAEQNAATAAAAQGEAQAMADAAATYAAIAVDNERDARALALASGAQLALSQNNTDLALALALRANQIGGTSTLQMQRTLAEAAYAPGTRRVFTGHTDRVTCVAYSPDGRYGLSGGRDNQVILWDIAAGSEVRRLSHHQDWIWDVAFSPDGSQAASASTDKTVILWDIASGAEIRRFQHDAAVRSVSFDADGQRLLAGDESGVLILWDAKTGKEIQRFTGDSTPVYDTAFSRNGFTTLSAGTSGLITLWNVTTGEPLTVFGLEGGHTDAVWALAYTPDETGFISASDDNSLILWNFETTQPVRRFNGHNSRVTSVAFSADGSRIVSGSEDNTLILWDTTTARALRRFAGHSSLVYGVAFSPDDRYVFSGSWDTTLRLWDMDHGAIVQRFEGHENGLLAAAFSPDGQTAITASADNTLRLWDTTTGSALQQFSGHSAPVNAVTFSGDGLYALSGSDDTSLILWDVSTGEPVRRFGDEIGHSDSVWAVAFTPDGRIAASGSRDNTIYLWDVATGAAIRRLFGHTFRVSGVNFSPDGARLVSSSFDNTIILWDVFTGEIISRFEGHTDWVRSAVFSPDGAFILSASADNTLILWNAENGDILRRFEGHTAQVYNAVFSPDGRYAASGAADSLVLIWDIASGTEIRRFAGHTDAVRGTAFSPDGRLVMSASGDGTALLWQIGLSVAEIENWSRSNRYIRELTCAERELYAVAPLCPTATPIFHPGSI